MIVGVLTTCHTCRMTSSDCTHLAIAWPASASCRRNIAFCVARPECKNCELREALKEILNQNICWIVLISKDCALLGCYAQCSGNSLPTFRDNLSGPNCNSLEGVGPIVCPETSVKIHHYSLRNSA